MTSQTCPTLAPWRVALPEHLQERARAILHDIAHALPQPTERLGGDLASGQAGLALFQAYYALAGFEHGCGRHRKMAEGHLEEACGKLPELANNPSLFAGYTGIAWTVDHLQSLGFIEGNEDLNEDVDDALLRFLEGDPRQHLCELIVGLVGYGMYGVGRAHLPKGRAIITRVLELLEASAEWHGAQVTWFTPPELLYALARETHPNGCYNLGLSHGVPGAVGFLAEAAALGESRAIPLLEGAVDWLLAQRRLHEDGSSFAYSFYPGEPRLGTRVAWCYGDLGISAVLLLAARIMDRPHWETAALALARATAARPVETSGAVDGSLCHGWFGNAHIFNRLWQATGEDEFHRAFLAWFEKGLAMVQPGKFMGGYSTYHPYDAQMRLREDPFVAEAGLLEGSAGIGLALMAALAPMEPAWDAHLLVHIPPRPHAG